MYIYLCITLSYIYFSGAYKVGHTFLKDNFRFSLLIKTNKRQKAKRKVKKKKQKINDEVEKTHTSATVENAMRSLETRNNDDYSGWIWILWI